jgi:hypothetical protein
MAIPQAVLLMRWSPARENDKDLCWADHCP